MSSFDFLNEKFLTFFVEKNGQISVEMMSTLERKAKISVNQTGFTEHCTIRNSGIVLSVIFTDNTMFGKDEVITYANKNEIASKIASELDANYNHCIVGECAFVFDEDNTMARKLIDYMKEMAN